MLDYAVLTATTMGVGGVGALYMAVRVGGFRALLPFGHHSILKEYFRGVKERHWPLWPPVLFGVSLLLALYFFFQFAKHPH